MYRTTSRSNGIDTNKPKTNNYVMKTLKRKKEIIKIAKKGAELSAQDAVEAVYADARNSAYDCLYK